MTIQVLVDTIDKETFQKILDFYNENKNADEPPLKRLDRAEGGFKIELPESEWEKDFNGFVDDNNKIRQLRWFNGELVSFGHRSFTAKQGILLYEALVYSLPPGSVILK
jgi:hypothetical protein